MENNVNLYGPLPKKELPILQEHVRRLLEFDPFPIYERLKGILDPSSRYNDTIDFNILFPEKKDGFCDCGCGKVVKGRKRWFKLECQNFATGVWQVISGRTQYIHWLFSNYTPEACIKCGSSPCEADHIVPVNKGGAGSWLGNFQYLCKECHKLKTRSDNGWVELKNKKKK